jgi:hypothetical protein
VTTLYYSLLGAGLVLACVFYWASGFRRPQRDSTSIVLFQMGHASWITVLGTHFFIREFIHHVEQHNVSGLAFLLLPFAAVGFAFLFFTAATFNFTLAASASIPTIVAYSAAVIALFFVFVILSSFIYLIS